MTMEIHAKPAWAHFKQGLRNEFGESKVSDGRMPKWSHMDMPINQVIGVEADDSTEAVTPSQGALPKLYTA